MKIELTISDKLSLEDAKKIYEVIKQLEKMRVKIKCTVDGSAASMANLRF